MQPTSTETPEPIEIDPREIVTQIISLTVNVEPEDTRWFVGYSIKMAQVGRFKIAGASLDSKLGRVVTLIRDDLPPA